MGVNDCICEKPLSIPGIYHVITGSMLLHTLQIIKTPEAAKSNKCALPIYVYTYTHTLNI